MKVEDAQLMRSADPNLIVLGALDSIDALETAAVAGAKPFMFEPTAEGRPVAEGYGHVWFNTLNRSCAKG